MPRAALLREIAGTAGPVVVLTASGWTTRWGDRRTKRPVAGLPSRAYRDNPLIVGKYRWGLYPRFGRDGNPGEAFGGGPSAFGPGFPCPKAERPRPNAAYPHPLVAPQFMQR